MKYDRIDNKDISVKSFIIGFKIICYSLSCKTI